MLHETAATTEPLDPEGDANRASAKKVGKCTLSKIAIALVIIAIALYCVIDGLTKPCQSTSAPTIANSSAPECGDGQTLKGTICVSRTSCVSLVTQAFIGWVGENVFLGAFILSIVYAIAVVALIPASLLTLGAGAAFGSALGLWLGVLVGSVSVFVGAAGGAMLAFVLGQHIFHDFVNRLIARFSITQAIDKAIEGDGLKVMSLLRLSPLIPFSALNYVMAGTSITMKNYFLALFAMIPATIA